jgi:hypothetical protein
MTLEMETGFETDIEWNEGHFIEIIFEEVRVG